MVKEMFNALRSAGAQEPESIEAVDALVEAVEGARTRQRVTQWAVLAILAFVAAITIRVFTL